MYEASMILLTALAGYLLGSVNTGIIVSRVFWRDDVRSHGSGSAGMTNMLRTYGKKAAVMTAAGDVLKGVLAVLLGQWLFGVLGLTAAWGGYLGYLGAVLGHWKPIYFGFRGGKCVLVAAGGLLAMHPLMIPLMLGVFLAVFLPTRMVSAGSIAMGAGYPILAWVYGSFLRPMPKAELWLFVLVAAVVSGIVIYLHRANIRRILNGTEYRFDGKEKEKQKKD